MFVNHTNAVDVLHGATRRSTSTDAVAWIAEGHPLMSGVDPAAVLQALIIAGGSGPTADAAVARMVASASASDFDTAAMLFAPELLPSPAEFRRALEVLARRTSDGTLATVDAAAVLTAQRENPQVLNTLCLAAGLSYRDLRDRVGGLPAAAGGPWDRESVSLAFGVIDTIVRGVVVTDVEGAVAARPVELMLPLGERATSWDDIQRFFTEGVPYEVLLTQRDVGTAWGAHRNRTSSQVRYATAAALDAELKARGVSSLVSSTVGGDVQPSAIEELAGTGKQLGLVALSRSHRPVIGVAFSTARDGGTARTNTGNLLMAKEAKIPVALVLTGLGWSGRNETIQLARAFGGRVFTDRSLTTLAADIASLAT